MTKHDVSNEQVRGVRYYHVEVLHFGKGTCKVTKAASEERTKSLLSFIQTTSSNSTDVTMHADLAGDFNFIQGRAGIARKTAEARAQLSSDTNNKAIIDRLSAGTESTHELEGDECLVVLSALQCTATKVFIASEPHRDELPPLPAASDDEPFCSHLIESSVVTVLKKANFLEKKWGSNLKLDSSWRTLLDVWSDTSKNTSSIKDIETLAKQNCLEQESPRLYVRHTDDCLSEKEQVNRQRHLKQQLHDIIGKDDDIMWHELRPGMHVEAHYTDFVHTITLGNSSLGKRVKNIKIKSFDGPSDGVITAIGGTARCVLNSVYFRFGEPQLGDNSSKDHSTPAAGGTGGDAFCWDEESVGRISAIGVNWGTYHNRTFRKAPIITGLYEKHPFIPAFIGNFVKRIPIIREIYSKEFNMPVIVRLCILSTKPTVAAQAQIDTLAAEASAKAAATAAEEAAKAAATATAAAATESAKATVAAKTSAAAQLPPHVVAEKAATVAAEAAASAGRFARQAAVATLAAGEKKEEVDGSARAAKVAESAKAATAKLASVANTAKAVAEIAHQVANAAVKVKESTGPDKDDDVADAVAEAVRTVKETSKRAKEASGAAEQACRDAEQACKDADEAFKKVPQNTATDRARIAANDLCIDVDFASRTSSIAADVSAAADTTAKAAQAIIDAHAVGHTDKAEVADDADDVANSRVVAYNASRKASDYNDLAKKAKDAAKVLA